MDFLPWNVRSYGPCGPTVMIYSGDRSMMSPKGVTDNLIVQERSCELLATDKKLLGGMINPTKIIVLL